MKISRITQWRQHLAHPRLTTRLFSPPPPPPPPVSPRQEDELAIVDHRDRAEQEKLCREAEPFTTIPVEPWRRVISGLLILVVFAVLCAVALLLL
jgi:hypothetical protein